MQYRLIGGTTALLRLAASKCGQPAFAKSLAAGFLLACMLAAGGTAEAQEATLVLDANTGAILYAYQENDQLHPASLTKMMTLYMAFEALRKKRLKPDQALGVSPHAAAQPPSKLKLKESATIETRDAILALITKSANDAAVVLAEAIADAESDFARAMTRKARKLGMADTVFRNASGLHEDGQVTTARDMARLAMRTITSSSRRAVFPGMAAATPTTIRCFPATRALTASRPAISGSRDTILSDRPNATDSALSRWFSAARPPASATGP
jgi:D-alanyl-D-alanine carboxypeptidase